jgi:hypothetical protein
MLVEAFFEKHTELDDYGRPSQSDVLALAAVAIIAGTACFAARNMLSRLTCITRRNAGRAGSWQAGCRSKDCIAHKLK